MGDRWAATNRRSPNVESSRVVSSVVGCPPGSPVLQQRECVPSGARSGSRSHTTIPYRSGGRRLGQAGDGGRDSPSRTSRTASVVHVARPDWERAGEPVSPRGHRPRDGSPRSADERIRPLGLALANIASDFVHAARDRTPAGNFASIPCSAGRTVLGYISRIRQRGQESAVLRRHFYYPHGWRRPQEDSVARSGQLSTTTNPKSPRRRCPI